MTKQKAMKSNASSSSWSGKEKGDIDLQDLSALSFPDFGLSVLDGQSQKVLPRYSAILKRQNEDAIGLEDLDALQLELEALLTRVFLRKLSLKDELKILSNLEKYKGQPQQQPHKRGLPSPEKRSLSNGFDIKPPKKIKSISSAGGGKPSDLNKSLGTSKVAKNSDFFDPLQNEQIRPLSDNSKPPQTTPKNETPSRFWAFVEPYCAPITSDDIKLLEDLIKTHDDISDYYRIPPLGEHYASRWAGEDLENERLKGSGEEEIGEKGSCLPKIEDLSKDVPTFYDLTQRLVAGLMEENVMTPIEDSMDGRNGCDEKDGGTVSYIKSESNTQSISATNPNSLEARVRKELEEQGILDKSSSRKSKNNDGPDEVLEELQRCQNELKAVSAHNIKQLKRLLHAAKKRNGQTRVEEKAIGNGQ
ncbi:TADA3 [Lepeophtheirus salmonis]|uniref:TADA3 n=1 Tax=Lepeophtheirus salmonis TaxID=72036 RepID=A0A7R8CIL0_LEPSM|nr:TADA3 [Lepeophtheirus salmonis]CAF2833545.1 TADA3 [Lepeophtheirus salmonis]